MKKFTLLFVFLLILAGCRKEEEQPAVLAEENLVTKIITPQGGTVKGPDEIQVVIPQNGVNTNVEVTVGYTGEEPLNFGNPSYSIIGKPFSIKMDYSKLSQQGMKIIINAPDDFDPNRSLIVCSTNPLLSLVYNFNRNTKKIEIIFDEIGDTIYNQLNAYTNFVFGIVMNKQFSNQDEIGFKQVQINNNVVTLNTLGTINQNEKILLLVHGWTSAPTDCWSTFVKKISPQIVQSNYNKMITFGYYSGLSINLNGQYLATFLKNLPAGVKVDIVAHSMGGLVSRSAIENHGATANVRNLVTLGTPHKGSLGGYLKNVIGQIIRIQFGSNSSLIGSFNTGSQGFEDLQNTSQFISSLNKNPIPSNVNYYPVAAIYKENQNYGSLPGIIKSTINGQLMLNAIIHSALTSGDGIVTRSSALGIQGNSNMTIGATFNLFAAVSHSAMVDDESVISHVAGKLNSYNTNTSNPYLNPNLNYGSVTDIDGNSYPTIQIGTQTWMAENLNTTKYNDGTNIVAANGAMTVGAYTNYGGLQYDTDAFYGKLYNNYAIRTKKLCPKNWHIPSVEELQTLISYLGGNVEASNKLRALFNRNNPSNTNGGATNESGFSAVMSGVYDWGSGYGFTGYNVLFGMATSTEHGSSYQKIFFLYAFPTYGIITINEQDIKDANSCRCIKD